MLLYADDCKMYRSVRNPEGCSLLQEDLNSFFQWCLRNKMSLNASKCYIMSYSRSFASISCNYMFNGVAVNRTNAFTDLGVIFDSKMSFSSRIDCITSKA